VGRVSLQRQLHCRPEGRRLAGQEYLPHFFTKPNEGRLRYQKRFEPKYYNESIRNLYKMLASEVDDVVGKIVQELKDQGVYDFTLLVFTTDNGNLHGEHGLAEK